VAGAHRVVGAAAVQEIGGHVTSPHRVGPSSPAETVRAAFEAFARNDRDAMSAVIADRFVWVFYDPIDEVPTLQMCTGRSEITRRMARNPASDWELIEMEAFGRRVVVTTSSRSDRMRPSWRTSDLNFHVVEVEDGRIVALRACLDRDEAIRLAGAADKSLNI
jgi:ketosteroid isomerase-like protein